ncbi:hypothetical protein B0H16DRAFT_1491666 [Mycena metata]|uniref:Protein kinase domain-containing protein n=1 Tax=Mycena metata TaxID=1033252 RepID=A0AAD7KET4_9AGAR|nr:hypothetical protein B0H16DRAFT_1491666 [Mycena metata]
MGRLGARAVYLDGEATLVSRGGSRLSSPSRLPGRLYPHSPRHCSYARGPRLPSTDFLHPVVDFVPGLALEYIDGPNMEQIKVGVDVSKDVAELISQRLIDPVAQIRNSCCRHNDLRLPNIILRGWPNDPH